MEKSAQTNTPTAVQNTPRLSNTMLQILIVILIIFIIFIIAGISYYMGFKGYKIALISDKQTPPVVLPTQFIAPSVVITLPLRQITLVPTREIQQIRACTLGANANSNLFASENKGICFLYAKQGGAVVPPVNIHTSEAGSKVFVYPANGVPANGQSVEVFEKDPADSLAQAIQKKFLAGINPQDCFIKVLPNGNIPPRFTKAQIAYPVPPGQAAFEVENNCPAGYRMTNGIAYFLMDTNTPDRFFYFSIGQYGIEAATGNQNLLWQDTIQVF
jgi:hypothetical protein